MYHLFKQIKQVIYYEIHLLLEFSPIQFLSGYLSCTPIFLLFLLYSPIFDINISKKKLHYVFVLGGVLLNLVKCLCNKFLSITFSFLYYTQFISFYLQGGNLSCSAGFPVQKNCP